MSDEMTAWLRAQVEADRAAARKATDGPWLIDGNAIRGKDREYHGGREGAVLVVKHTWPQEAAHIVIHDPRDVIADCDAKLRLLDLHEPINGVGGGIECEACGPNNGSPPGLIAVIRDDDGFWPCATVLVLASGYRHRDGWQETWSA